jgi:hypothetical protein
MLLLTLTIAGTLVAVPPQLHAQTSAQNAAAKAVFMEGVDFWDDGKFADAEKKFRETLVKYPRAEQSDRTSFYLITTLMKLGRTDEARAEIQNFYRNYPQSSWMIDVEEKRIDLGMPGPPFGPGYRFYAQPPVVVHPVQVSPQLQVHGRFAPPITVNVNAALEQALFRVIIQTDANYAISMAKERLKANPSDPAVVSNFSLIAGSGSPQAFPFFITVASDGPTPNTQTQARFWIGRLNNAQDAVGRAFIALTSERTLPVVAEVLSRTNPAERSNVLKQVVEHPSPEKVIALKKVFKVTTVQPFKSQIVESAGTVPESAAREFLTDVAKHETEYSVRLSAIQALGARTDVDVTVLGDIMRTLPSVPAPPPAPALRRAKTDEKVEGIRMQPTPRTRNSN